MLRHKKKAGGATLIELMGSVLIFMLGLIAVMTVFQQSASSGHRSDYTYTAYNIAKNHIERLKAVNFNTLSSAGETETLVDQNGSPDPNGLYTRSTIVTPYPGYTSNLMQVDVSVFYTLQGQKNTPTTITALIYGG